MLDKLSYILFTIWSRIGGAWDRFRDKIGERFSQERLSEILQNVLDSLLILLVAIVVIWLMRRLLLRLERRVERVKGLEHRKRIETITSLIASTIKYTVYIATAIAVLATWHVVDPATLAFGTAAIGAAIGFGSQGLVQDVITGLSILAEDQLAVGDYVDVGGKSGIVEEIGLRVIKLRDHLGVQHVIFNRTIAGVSNYTAGAMQALVDVSLQSMDDAVNAKRIAAQVSQDIAAELPYFPEVPEIEGVQQSSTRDIFLRIKLHVLPQQQTFINEVYVDRLKHAFAAEKVTIPDGRVRVTIISDLFRKAMGRVKPNALPAGPAKIYEGAV